MNWNINISDENEAFDEAPVNEIARILRDLADRIEGGLEDVTDSPLRDINGNTVGSVEVTR